MKPLAASLLVAGAFACGTAAFGENSPDNSSANPSPQELMQTCMQQVKARNPGAADADMRTVCDAWVAQQVQRLNGSDKSGGSDTDQTNPSSNQPH